MVRWVPGFRQLVRPTERNESGRGVRGLEIPPTTPPSQTRNISFPCLSCVSCRNTISSRQAAGPRPRSAPGCRVGYSVGEQLDVGISPVAQPKMPQPSFANRAIPLPRLPHGGVKSERAPTPLSSGAGRFAAQVAFAPNPFPSSFYIASHPLNRVLCNLSFPPSIFAK